MQGISTEYAGYKAALSFGFQAIMNGPRNVDYLGVAADAWTAPGLDAIIQGAVNWRPFSHETQFELLGYNKDATHFAIDAGATFFGGMIGYASWRPMEPLLHNTTERVTLFMSTQAWITAGSTGASNILNKKYEAK